MRKITGSSLKKETILSDIKYLENNIIYLKKMSKTLEKGTRKFIINEEAIKNYKKLLEIQKNRIKNKEYKK